VRCVRRHVEFVKYDFVPDFEGKFLGVGFGFLLRENNRIINTLINQLIDAGTAENAGGGFVGKEATLKGGAIDHHPGEWLMVNTRGQDLRQAMVPIPRPSPSPVLFQMLGFMVEAGKEMASIRDVLTGEASANQPATTTMAIIEQGLQVFSSIYKRIFRAAGREFSLHYQYNSAYLPPDKYMQQTDDPEANFQYDFLIDGYDIMPVADPSVTTKAQELARAEFLNVYRGDPNVDQREITIRQMKAAGIENIEALVPPENPQAKAEQAKKMELEVRRVIAEIVKDEAAANKMAAETAGARVDAAAGLQDIKMRDLEVALKLGVSNVSGSNGGLGGMAGPSEYGAIPQTNGMGSQGMPQPVDGMALAGIEPGPVGPAPTEFAGT
jgi:chaperonin GroES